ncbi:unnamed protein product [Adineta steineri]|uniref:Uncharacterized protein n=1 Tax=Adineta steineri TaxID=433720 RepID=A0A818WV53_9BILA|nr:unnamed protein product [Adineta steineri]CAF3730045.1 unnamed protein product [Adineta steineri]
MSKLNRKVVLIAGASERAEHAFITGRRQEMLDEPVKKISSTIMADLDNLCNVIKKGKGRLNIVTIIFRDVVDSDVTKSTFITDLIAIVPLTWTGMPDRTIKTAVFRASDDSSYITRIELFVDGGKE